MKQSAVDLTPQEIMQIYAAFRSAIWLAKKTNHDALLNVFTDAHEMIGNKPLGTPAKNDPSRMDYWEQERSRYGCE